MTFVITVYIRSQSGRIDGPHFREAISALVLPCCALLGIAHATNPLPPETRLVLASNAPTATEPMAPFTISPAEDLIVTLTD